MMLAEVNDALQTMVIRIDTREQNTVFLRRRIRQFETLGCTVQREKLDAGDYGVSFFTAEGEKIDLPVVIERKMNLDELVSCYCGGRKRFKAEFERAKKANLKVYLLIEGGSWENMYRGKYYSKMAPKALIASILSWLAKFNCVPVFCESYTTGQLIFDIFYREGKHYLETRCDDYAGEQV